MPSGQGRQLGLSGLAAKCPGLHMVQLGASTVVEAQPAGQMLHQGSWAGGTGQPVHITTPPHIQLQQGLGFRA